MAATINTFISALHSPADSFASLGELKLEERGDRGAVSRTTHFADAVVEWGAKRYLLSMPLSAEGRDMAQRAAVALRRLRSPLLLEYRLLASELNYIDSRGVERQSDILIEELPAGSPLSESVAEINDAPKLYESISRMEREFERLHLTHSNLKAENIIVGHDYTLYPLRLHYAVVGAAAADNFDTLRQFVAAATGVAPLEPTQFEPSDRQASEPSNAMGGYLHLGNPFEGLCVCQTHQGYGYLDLEGREVIAPQFAWAANMREGRAEVETFEGLMGLIDAQGRYIIPPRYQIIEFDTSTGHTLAKQNNKWRTFDYEGRPLEEVTA